MSSSSLVEGEDRSTRTLASGADQGSSQSHMPLENEVVERRMRDLGLTLDATASLSSLLECLPSFPPPSSSSSSNHIDSDLAHDSSATEDREEIISEVGFHSSSVVKRLQGWLGGKRGWKLSSSPVF